MDDVRARHAQALDAFGRLVAGVGPDGWAAPTPCADWSVRDLVAHLVDEQRWTPALLAGRRIADVEAAWTADPLGDDPVAAWVAASAAAREAAAHVRLDAPVHLSYGEVPARHYVEEMTFDLVVHAWDLARATGRPDDLDPGLVERVLAWAGPRLAELRDSGPGGSGPGESGPGGSAPGEAGLFARPVPVGTGADALARLVALTGRDPLKSG